MIGQTLGHRVMFFDYGTRKCLAKEAYRHSLSIRERHSAELFSSALSHEINRFILDNVFHIFISFLDCHSGEWPSLYVPVYPFHIGYRSDKPSVTLLMVTL